MDEGGSNKNLNVSAASYGKKISPKWKEINKKLSLLVRYFGFINCFVVASFLGLAKIRPTLAFFLSQALPIYFECGDVMGSWDLRYEI